MATPLWSYSYVVLTVYLDEKGAERAREIYTTFCISGTTNDPQTPLPTVLREMGNRGWEMVGVVNYPRVNTEETHFYFKRSEQVSEHGSDELRPPIRGRG